MSRAVCIVCAPQVRFVPPSAGPALVSDPSALVAGTQPCSVITASVDKSMALWSPDGDSGMWMPTSRVGEVGGHTLGFFGGLVSPLGSLILAHGYLVRAGSVCGGVGLVCIVPAERHPGALYLSVSVVVVAVAAVATVV